MSLYSNHKGVVLKTLGSFYLKRVKYIDIDRNTNVLYFLMCNICVTL